MVEISTDEHKVYITEDEYIEFKESKEGISWTFPHDKLEKGQIFVLVSKCFECGYDTKEIKIIGFKCFYCGSELTSSPEIMYIGLSTHASCIWCLKKKRKA